MAPGRETAMKGYVKTLRYLVWLTQLGFSVAIPLVGFILLGVWLHNSKGWGGWTVPVGIALGLLGAAGGLRNSLKLLNQMLRQDEEKAPMGYNRHE